MLRTIGKILLIACPVALTLTIFLLLQLSEEDSNAYREVLTILCLFFATGFCLCFTFIHFNSSAEKRKKVVRNLSSASFFLLAFGLFNKFMHWRGASIEIIIGVFLFTFGALPLIIRNRYEKRRGVLSGSTIIWSFTDLAGIVFISLAGLGKFMHWPVWQLLFAIGGLIFLVSVLGWNISFRKEVRLKMEAEEKLKKILKQVEDNNREIEEKQKAIIDSIEYAKRIQKAQIPSEKYIKNALDRLMKK